MSTQERYYLVSEKYRKFDKGSIVRYDGTCLYHIDDDDMALQGQFPNHFVELSKGEAHYLKKEEISDRLIMHQSGLFNKINILKPNDECFYISGKTKHKGFISGKKDSNDCVYFDVTNPETKSESRVIANDIVLVNEGPPKSIGEIYYLVSEGKENIEYRDIMVVSDSMVKKYQGSGKSIKSEMSLDDLISKSLKISNTDAERFYDIQMQIIEKNFPENSSNKNKLCSENNEMKSVDDSSKCNEILDYDKNKFDNITKQVPKQLSSSRDMLQNQSASGLGRVKKAERESSVERVASHEEYEKCILDLSECPKFKDHAKFIACLKGAVRICGTEIVLNLVTNSEYVIDLKTDAALFDSIVQRGDIDTIISLLRRCDFSEKDNKALVNVMERYLSIDIITLVTKKIKDTKSTDEVNRSLLKLAFSFLDWMEAFEMVISACTKVDDFVDEKDTFLTKMIIEKNLDDMKKVMKICTFDLNKHNRDGKAPIVLACQRQPDSGMLEQLAEMKTPFNADDIYDAQSICYQDRDTRNKFYSILHKCERR